MSQYTLENPIVAPHSGADTAAAINAVLGVILSGSSGNSRPDNIELGGQWVKSTVDVDVWEVMLFDGTNDIKMGEFDKDTHVWTPSNTIGQVKDDTSPQLGGFLATNGHMVKWSKAVAASATTMVLAPTANVFDVTGDIDIEGIADIGTTGTSALLVFSGTPTLINSANFKVQGNANFTITAGDKALVTQTSSAPTWDVTIFRADGKSTIASENPVKAWVNFNGVGTVAIRSSDNVSSITDNGTGNYSVNFDTNMADVNYAAVPSVVSASTSATTNTETFATGSVVVRTKQVNSGLASAFADFSTITLIVVGN